jgi:hypothetical protein
MGAVTDWHDFFLGLGGAAAGLTGLLLVALSLHPARALSAPLYRTRALGMLAGMLWVTLASLVLLLPERLLWWAAFFEAWGGLAGLASQFVIGRRVRGEVGYSITRSAINVAYLLMTVVGAGILMTTSATDLGLGILAIAFVSAILNLAWQAWLLIADEPPINTP